MSDINIELLQTVIPIVELGTNKPVSFGVIVSFSAEGQNSSRPFLIFPISEIFENKKYGITFKAKAPTNTYFATFDFGFCQKQKLDEIEFAAFPIAGLLNDLEKKNIILDFKSFSYDQVLFDLEKNKVNSFELLTTIGMEKIFAEDVFCLDKVYNITPFVKNNKLCEYFYLRKNSDTAIGCPVLIFNEGSYTSGSSVYVGNRLFLIGVIDKADDKFYRAISASIIINKIKNKYDFLK